MVLLALGIATAASPFGNFQIERSELKLCNPCVQLGGQAINILLNEILNAGVIGGCSKLCKAAKGWGDSDHTDSGQTGALQ